MKKTSLEKKIADAESKLDSAIYNSTRSPQISPQKSLLGLYATIGLGICLVGTVGAAMIGSALTGEPAAGTQTASPPNSSPTSQVFAPTLAVSDPFDLGYKSIVENIGDTANQILVPGDTVYISARQFNIDNVYSCVSDDPSTGAYLDRVCVYIERVSSDKNLAIGGLYPGQTKIAVTEQQSIDEVLSLRTPSFFSGVNCGDGCAEAEVYLKREDGRVEHFYLYPDGRRTSISNEGGAAAQESTSTPSPQANSPSPYVLLKSDRNSSGEVESVSLNAGEFLYVSAGQFRIADEDGRFNCYYVDNNQGGILVQQICVYIRQAGKDETISIENLIQGHAWIAQYEASSADDILNDRLKYFWQAPNCTGGCEFARVFVEDATGNVSCNIMYPDGRKESCP